MWPSETSFSRKFEEIRTTVRLSKRKRGRRRTRERRRGKDRSQRRRRRRRRRHPRRAIEFWWVGETYLITSSIPPVLQLSVDRTVDCCLTALVLYIVSPSLSSLREARSCHFLSSISSPLDLYWRAHFSLSVWPTNLKGTRVKLGQQDVFALFIFDPTKMRCQRKVIFFFFFYLRSRSLRAARYCTKDMNFSLTYN